jgi:hypothetical protein
MVTSPVTANMIQVLHNLNSMVAEPFRDSANPKRINRRWVNAVCRIVTGLGGDAAVIREWVAGEEVRAALEGDTPVLPRHAPVLARYTHAVDDRGNVWSREKPGTIHLSGNALRFHGID